jgi:hypothetical protein
MYMLPPSEEGCRGSFLSPSLDLAEGTERLLFFIDETNEPLESFLPLIWVGGSDDMDTEVPDPVPSDTEADSII